MRWPAATLVLAIVSHVAAQEPESTQSEKFAGWPAGWVTAYNRFENYIAARRASWPSAQLEISEQGRITHGVRLAESRSEHLTLCFFRRGRQVLGMGIPKGEELLSEGRKRILTPGPYMACLWASGPVGYQHIYPFIGLDVVNPGKSGEEDGPQATTIRMIPLPAEPESIWPNERLFLFLDFHIFPKGHPSNIEKANRKVQPAILLRLNNQGRIERDKLDGSGEALLRWRIYFDGKLIDRASAAGVTRYEPSSGFGTYQILLGVDGPNGFMPVSNLLEFPLFPDPTGKGIVVPADRDGDGAPDLAESIIVLEAEASTPADADTDTDNDGVPDREEAGNRATRAKPPQDEAQRRLFELWGGWEYELKNHPPTRP